MYMAVPSVQNSVLGSEDRLVQNADVSAGVSVRSSHMRLIGEHMCMPGIPRQIWLKLANGAAHPPVLFVHDLPANDAKHPPTEAHEDATRRPRASDALTSLHRRH